MKKINHIEDVKTLKTFILHNNNDEKLFENCRNISCPINNQVTYPFFISNFFRFWIFWEFFQNCLTQANFDLSSWNFVRKCINTEWCLILNLFDTIYICRLSLILTTFAWLYAEKLHGLLERFVRDKNVG